MSKDNFESCVLTFLRATTFINDDEEAKLSSWYENKDGSIHLNISTTTEKQLYLPFGHPDEG